jgi:hypothetical protein
MRPTDVDESGWRTGIAERTQYRPHSLYNHRQKKQFAAVKGSGRGDRGDSVCVGPVGRSIGRQPYGPRALHHGLDAHLGTIV